MSGAEYVRRSSAGVFFGDTFSTLADGNCNVFVDVFGIVWRKMHTTTTNVKRFTKFRSKRKINGLLVGAVFLSACTICSLLWRMCVFFVGIIMYMLCVCLCVNPFVRAFQIYDRDSFICANVCMCVCLRALDFPLGPTLPMCRWFCAKSAQCFRF